MGKMGYQQKFLVFLVMVLIAPSAWSNRCAGRDCNPPAFKDMVPAAGSAVSRGSDFSFTASPNTNPRSIRVMVKGHEVALEVLENTTPIQVLEQHGVPLAEVHLVLVNGIFVPPSQRDRPLKPGDVLAVWPAVAGG